MTGCKQLLENEDEFYPWLYSFLICILKGCNAVPCNAVLKMEYRLPLQAEEQPLLEQLREQY